MAIVLTSEDFFLLEIALVSDFVFSTSPEIVWTGYNAPWFYFPGAEEH